MNAQNPIVSNSPYANYLKSKSHDELVEISHIKRFLECVTGDPDFRNIIATKKIPIKTLLVNRGLKLENIESLRPIFDPDFTHFRGSATIETWPLAAKWDEYYKSISGALPYYLHIGDSDGEFKEFDNWRKNQVVRTLMDVGSAASFLIHPPIAFELSDGCSVGCWFCGISASKFGGHFEANEYGLDEWRSILVSVKKILGRGMSTGFCYWATEPLDHPDYVKFLKIYEDVVGVVPQTTTAIPLRDVKLTRDVLDLWKESKYVPNRFSVLSLSTMKKIHAEFTPEELLGVELVMQGKGSTSPKSVAGRALSKPKRRDTSEEMQAGTIACVSGFLINLPKRTIRLVSPTLATLECPDGYYVFASETFSDPLEIEVIMRRMIHKEASREADSKQNIKLNKNYWVEKIGSQMSIRDKDFGMGMDMLNIMAPMLQNGKHTPNDIIKKTIKAGHDPLLSIKVMRELMAYGMAGDYLRPNITLAFDFVTVG
jgi:radical SAM family RiPP maturation amino acid epimerase